MNEIIAEPHILEYFSDIKEKVQKQLKIAREAKKIGIDPSTEIETKQTTDLAERTETIIGPVGVAKRYRELTKSSKKDRIQVIFQIFREILEQKWIEIPDDEKRLEQAIKTCLMLNTEGVVVAPIDGVPEIKISKNFDRTKYVNIYYAGPIRAAGGTSTVLPLILGDYAKTLMGLDRYKPTEDEIERYVEEAQIYEHIFRRQYRIKAEEVRQIIRGCPVCINGEPTEEKEVAIHRNLERIPSNRLRGAVCIVISDGVALKARKILTFAKMLKLDWSWLESIIKVGKHGEQKEGEIGKHEMEPSYNYLEGLAAGRPIFCYPSRPGGFRLRYGRSRGGGIMGKSIHPATMYLLDEFPAIGTQLKIERPGKAAGIQACDSIEGPIVKLRDKSVMQLHSAKEVEKVKESVQKILFLGDILVNYGDFKHSAHPLLPAGYCEEWWWQEVKATENKALIKEAEELMLQKKLMQEMQEGKKIDGEKAVQEKKDIGKKAFELSEKYGIPFHPDFMAYYCLLTKEETIYLIKKMQNIIIEKEGKKIAKALLENEEETKRLLEKVGLEHHLEGENIAIEGEKVFAFMKLFGAIAKENGKESNDIDFKELSGTELNGKEGNKNEKEANRKKINEINFDELRKKENGLSVLTAVSGINLREKSGTFIGARMGRPESSSERKMKGNPHVLFPIGNAGGSIRSINKAAEKKEVEVEIALFKCPVCKKVIHSPLCEECNVRTEKIKQCRKCGREIEIGKEKCSACGENIRGYSLRKLNVEKELSNAAEKLKIKIPKIVKGVRGMMSANKVAEPLEKGILRAKYELHIFRDGTIRYELINNALTHFKPKEISTGIEKLKEMGYKKDKEGNDLENEEQILELMPQDIIVHEEAGEFFTRVSQFVDEELEKLYEQKPIYNIHNKEELIGELVLGLAPHTSAAIVGRIIGYTKARGCFAHPYFHQAKRRNCLIGKTPVLLNEGNTAHLVSIDSLDNGSMEEEIPLKNIHTFTVDENGDIKREKVIALFKQKSPKKLIKIRTRFGRTLTVTPKQKILFENNGKADYKFAEELKKGERLLSLRQFNVEKPVKEIDVLEWYCKNLTEKEKETIRIHNVKKDLEKLVEENGGCWKVVQKTDYRQNQEHYKRGKALHTAIDFDSIPLNLFEKLLNALSVKPSKFKNIEISYNKQKSRIKATVSINKELGELIGYYLADGYARTTADGKRKKYVYQVSLVSAEKNITDRFLRHIEKIFKRKATVEKMRDSVENIVLSGRVYYDLFVSILKCGKNAKSKRVPIQVINAETECVTGALTGYFVGDGGIDKTCIKASSVNKELINDFSLLTARLGLFAHLFEEKEREITTGVVKKFYEKKGKKIFIKAYGLRLYSTDFEKISPFFFGKKLLRARNNMKKFPISKKRINTLGNFVLDKITESKEIESKEKYVYDLIVEGEKTFIGGFGNLAIYDCDGEQDSLTLMMDALLNFSQEYLPEHRGGRMDAPLVFTSILNPSEIDDEVHKMETCKEYPLELYENALKYAPPEIEGIETIASKLGTETQYSRLNYTHETSDFAAGPKYSRYVQLKSMEEKINLQAELQSRIAAVDAKDSIERVLMSHFLPDCIGNVRSFSKQKFRCTNCNAKYRRIPLTGQCSECNQGHLILTISEGSVIKYVEIAKQIIQRYGLSDYLKQRMNLIEQEISSVFKSDQVKQKSLSDYM